MELDDLLENAEGGVGGRSIYVAVNENRRGKGVWERDMEARLMNEGPGVGSVGEGGDLDGDYD